MTLIPTPWRPLARGLLGLALGVGLGVAWGKEQWALAAAAAILILVLLVPETIKQYGPGSKVRCHICGAPALWLWSTVPPPRTLADRAMTRYLMGIWAMWGACDEHHDEVGDRLDDVFLRLLREDGSSVKLYGIPASWTGGR